MSTVLDTSTAETVEDKVGESMWSKAAYKFRRDRTGMMGLSVVALYMLVALGVVFGLWGTEWSDNNGQKWEGISSQYWFGTNILGQDIYERAIFSTKTAFEVGLVVAVISTLIGAILGALSGFFSNTWIDAVSYTHLTLPTN